MEHNWTKVFTTTNPIEAEIILSMLHEHDIEAVEMNKRDSSYLAFGTVEVYCPAEKAITALHLINNNDLI
ncbi:hypothetical protein AEM51_02375 [Bacteroidetes bacterium UKL13-3]|jgi:hypothetical protein|nr:hypothetical protein AEM51_02375 [Bacteroidetes bacterium UKL13-3]HCP93324.1 hypothetical protein [Bacteroidota bacterium]